MANINHPEEFTKKANVFFSPNVDCPDCKGTGWKDRPDAHYCDPCHCLQQVCGDTLKRCINFNFTDSQD